jgi:hypothetical protein
VTGLSPKQCDRAFGGSGKLGVHLLLVIILIAFASHAYRLDAKSMWIDEGLSIYRAGQDPSTILSNAIVIQGFRTYDTHPPLYFILLHLLIRVAGDSEFAYGFLSVAWGVLLVPLFYALGKGLLGHRVGLWSAAIAAASPVYLWYSQEARGYTMLVCLTLFSNYALLRLWRLAKESERRLGQIILWVMACLLGTIAAVLTHYGAIFVLIFQWAAVLAMTIRLRRPWMIGLWAGASLSVMPFLGFILTRLQTPAERGYRFVPLWEIARDLLNAFSLGIAVRLEYVFWLDFLFLLVFVLGLVALLRDRTKPRMWTFSYLLGYLLIPTLALYLLSYRKPMYAGARHLLIVSPPYYLILGVGLDTLRRRFRYLAIMVMLLLAGGIACSTFNHFFDPRYAKDDVRSMVRYVRDHRKPREIVVLGEPILGPLWEYYYGPDLLWTALPVFPFEVNEQTTAQAAALADTYDGIWFAYSPPTDRDKKGLVKAWLDENLFQIDDIPFHSVNNFLAVAHYLTRPPLLAEPPAMMREMDLNFGNELLLLGHYGLPDQSQASEESSVTFYWQVLSRPVDDYSLSLRLLGGDGLRWSQTDIVPFNGFYPTSRWEPGTTVAQTVSVPPHYGIPRGRYTWELRLYSPVTWRELQVFDGAGMLLGSGAPVGTVEVAATSATLLPQMPIRYPLQAEFGRVMRLVGYDLAEMEWRAGETLHLEMYWQYLLATSEHYSVLVQLTDIAGRTLREEASALADGPAGSIARQQYSLVIPPEAAGQRCSLIVEVQSAETGSSLAVGPHLWPLKRATLALAQILIAEEARLFQEPIIEHPLEAHLGEQIEFLGYDLRNASVAAGGKIDLVLYWRASREMGRSYTVFIHILDHKGGIWAQGDSLPCKGARLTSGWIQGEVIVDRHEISLGEYMPPGRYRLIWGMYDASTGMRLPVFDPADEPIGDVIEGVEIDVVP